MYILKQLLDGIHEKLKSKQLVISSDSPDDKDIRDALISANKWLNTTKSFEYSGKISTKFRLSSIKLDALEMDLDDIIRALCNSPESGIDAEVEFWLIVKDKPLESKKGD